MCLSVTLARCDMHIRVEGFTFCVYGAMVF